MGAWVSSGRNGVNAGAVLAAGPFLTKIPQSWMKMEPFEVIEVETTTVACDGGGGALGHPRVYLTLSKEGEIECPYCSRKYVLREGAHAAAH
jgi:uncharacterized Zn-finger protein